MMNKYYYHSLSIQLEDFLDSIYISKNLIGSRAENIRNIYDDFNRTIGTHLENFLNLSPKESDGYRIIIGCHNLAEKFCTWYSYLLEMKDSPFSEPEKERIKEAQNLCIEAQEKFLIPIKRQMQDTYVLAKYLDLYNYKEDWLNIKIKQDLKQKLDGISGRESGDISRLEHICNKLPKLNKKFTALFEYCLDEDEEKQAAFVKEQLEGLLEEAIKEDRTLLREEVDKIITGPKNQEIIQTATNRALIDIYSLAAYRFNSQGTYPKKLNNQPLELWAARILNEAYSYRYTPGEAVEEIEGTVDTLRSWFIGKPKKMRMDTNELSEALYTEKNEIFFSSKPKPAAYQIQRFRQWFFPDFLAALFFPSPYGLIRTRILMKFLVEDPYANADAQTSSLCFLEELISLSIKGAVERPVAYTRDEQRQRYYLPHFEDDCRPELDLLVKIVLPKLIADLEDRDIVNFLQDGGGEAQNFIQEICEAALWQILSNEINDMGGEWIENVSYTSRYFKEEFALQLEKLGLPKEAAQKFDISKTTDYSFIFRFIRQTQKGDSGIIMLINAILDIIKRQCPVEFILNQKTSAKYDKFRLQNKKNWEQLKKNEKPCSLLYRGAFVPCQLTRESLFGWDKEKTDEDAIFQNRLKTKLLSDIRHMEIHSSGYIDDIKKLSGGKKEINLEKICKYFQNEGRPNEKTPNTLEGLMSALIYFQQENPQAEEVSLCKVIIEVIRTQRSRPDPLCQEECSSENTLLELLNKVLHDEGRNKLPMDRFKSLLNCWKKLCYQSEEFLQLAEDILKEIDNLKPIRLEHTKSYELEGSYSEELEGRIVRFLSKAFYLNDKFFIQNNRLRLIIYMLYWAVELSNGDLSFGAGIENENTVS